MKIILKLILFLDDIKNYNLSFLLIIMINMMIIFILLDLILILFNYLYIIYIYYAKCKHLSNDTQYINTFPYYTATNNKSDDTLYIYNNIKYVIFGVDPLKKNYIYYIYITHIINNIA